MKFLIQKNHDCGSLKEPIKMINIVFVNQPNWPVTPWGRRISVINLVFPNIKIRDLPLQEILDHLLFVFDYELSFFQLKNFDFNQTDKTSSVLIG